MAYKYIILLLVIVVGCLVVQLYYTKENFAFRDFVVDVNEQGVPTSALRDETGALITDYYYLEPSGTDKWSANGKYKKYTVKQIPYGYKLVNESDATLGIRPATDVATSSSSVSAMSNLPDYRELYFTEYGVFPGKPNWKNTPTPPSGYFNVGNATNGVYQVAKIPPNHALLDTAQNPAYKYLKYTGSYENIPGYTYTDTNTGEFTTTAGSTTVERPPAGKYKIKLVKEYDTATNTPRVVKYVVANIPQGWKLDPNDPTYTKLITDTVKYDSTNMDAYHEDVTDDRQTYYQFDDNGQLVEINTQENNFAPILYYVPGAYKFGSSNYVPNYEDSVYLSRTTRESQLAPVVNTASQLGGFCKANVNSPQTIEEKCNATDLNSCASMSCCVLLGGEKCVAGNANGPHFTANYSDYGLRNKDFYYYQGKCYGNCP